MGKLGWSGRCPACGARGRLRRGGGGGCSAPGRSFLPAPGAGSAGTRAGNAETRHRGVPKWNSAGSPPTHSPLPTGRPARAPWERGGQASLPASQPDRSPRTENSGQNFLKGGEKKEKKGGKKCLDQWGIYAKTHMICNVSMRICIRYHHPSCHPGSGSAESYKVKFSSLRRRRRNVNFQAGARGVGGGEASPQGAGY